MPKTSGVFITKPLLCAAIEGVGVYIGFDTDEDIRISLSIRLGVHDSLLALIPEAESTSSTFFGVVQLSM